MNSIHSHFSLIQKGNCFVLRFFPRNRFRILKLQIMRKMSQKGLDHRIMKNCFFSLDVCYWFFYQFPFRTSSHGILSRAFQLYTISWYSFYFIWLIHLEFSFKLRFFFAETTWTWSNFNKRNSLGRTSYSKSWRWG